MKMYHRTPTPPGPPRPCREGRAAPIVARTVKELSQSAGMPANSSLTRRAAFGPSTPFPLPQNDLDRDPGHRRLVLIRHRVQPGAEDRQAQMEVLEEVTTLYLFSPLNDALEILNALLRLHRRPCGPRGDSPHPRRQDQSGSIRLHQQVGTGRAICRHAGRSRQACLRNEVRAFVALEPARDPDDLRPQRIPFGRTIREAAVLRDADVMNGDKKGDSRRKTNVYLQPPVMHTIHHMIEESVRGRTKRRRPSSLF
jgi:hypothetical protein